MQRISRVTAQGVRDVYDANTTEEIEEVINNTNIELYDNMGKLNIQEQDRIIVIDNNEKVLRKIK